MTEELSYRHPLFKSGSLYILETSRRYYLAHFGGYCPPYVAFNNVTVVDEGKHTHFLKTGELTSKDLKGAFAWKAGFWINERWIMQAIEVGVTAPKVKLVKDPVAEAKDEKTDTPS